MTELLTYADGIPRYGALWVLATPVVAAVARAAGVRGRHLRLLVATTLPTLGLHVAAVPWAWPFAVRWGVVVASLVAVGWLLGGLLRAAAASATHDARPSHRWPVPPVVVVVALVVVAVALRAALAVLDPGISDIPQASEAAARQLLAGDNPYVTANPHTVAGVYQYPAGTLLWHLPFVALLPAGGLLGEPFVAARAAAWAVDAAVVAALAWLGLRTPLPRWVALAPAVVWAVHPTVLRETGLTAANDVAMGVLVAAAGWVLARRARPGVAGVLLGLAVAVKPPAAALVPAVAVLAGWRTVLVAGGVAAALQLPFLLWPEVGLHGIAALLEPVARAEDGYEVLRFSLWWPVYAVAGASAGVVRAAGIAAVGAAAAVGWWTARRIGAGEGTGSPAAVLAALALPLLVLFLLAPGWRANFQDWMLPAAVLAALTPALPRPGGGGP